MSITGIVGLKSGYEKAISSVNGPHLQCQFMIKKDTDTSTERIEPDCRAYIFRPSIHSSRNISDIKDKAVYPSLGPLKIPTNAVGMIMFGLQHEFSSDKELLNSMKPFNINEPPTGIAHGAVHFSEIISPQFFTFAVRLTGELFKEGVDSRYHHLYESIQFDLTEDKNQITIKSIKLKESLYRIKTVQERYEDQLVAAYIENQ